MARVYTFCCPHCSRPDVNVWTRGGTRWYFCPHVHPRACWNGSAWVERECTASNCHVPLMIAKHMRAVYRSSPLSLRRWYHGRAADRALAGRVGGRPD